MSKSCGKIYRLIFWTALILALTWMSLPPARGEGCEPGNRPGGVCRLMPSRPTVPVRQQPLPAIVRISMRCTDGTVGYGSGTLVWRSPTHDRAIVLTCWHITRDTVGQPTVTFPNGDRFAARILKVDRLWDLAALAIRRPTIKPMAIAERTPQVGDRLSVAGYGSGRYRIRSGRVLRYASPSKTSPDEIVQVLAPIMPGDSGGPMIDSANRLAGVIFGGKREAHGTHCGRIRKFLQGLTPAAAQVSRPPAATPPVPSILQPYSPPKPTPTDSPLLAELKKLTAQIVTLQARVAALKKIEPIPAGNDGPPGPTGKIDYKKLPPITVQTVKDGQVIETVRVYLGEVLSLQLVPVQ